MLSLAALLNISYKIFAKTAALSATSNYRHNSALTKPNSAEILPSSAATLSSPTLNTLRSSFPQSFILFSAYSYQKGDLGCRSG
jgi:hypothetical protein